MANILLVDDQECVRDIIGEQLTADGHDVKSVGDVASAMGQVASGWPDLVLLDLYLAGLLLSFAYRFFQRPQNFGI